MLFYDDNQRKPIPMKTKRKVYERANKKCEKCGTPLEMNHGDFHHTRDPTVTPRASSVRFLCPTCHRKYGHKRRTTKTETLFGVEKKTKIVRQKVVKITETSTKKPKTRRKAIKDIFGNTIGYKTVKVKESTKTKKSPKKPIVKKKRKRKTNDDFLL